MIARALALIVLCICQWRVVAGATSGHLDQARQLLGKANVMARDGRSVEAAREIDAAIAELQLWKRSIVDPGADSGAEDDAAVEDEEIELAWKTTHEAASCRERAAEGDKLRVHFVAKVLATGKVVDSSFHTGSTPLRLELGSDTVPPAWNQGLVGMCPGERRSIQAPASLSRGGRVGRSPAAQGRNMEFFVELVEMTKARANRRDEL